MSGRYDITIEQGATFCLPMTIKNHDGSHFDLTNWTGRGQIRKSHRATTVICSFVFTYHDRLKGKMEAGLSDEVTQQIPAGEVVTDPRSKYVYDIEIENTTGQVKRLLEGNAYVSPEVTRS